MAEYELHWNGAEVLRVSEEKLSQIMGRIGLEVEGDGKKELRKGHGVITGTLRRSLHCAEAGFDWPGDDMEPNEASPELGGQVVEVSVSGHQVSIEVGSGLRYALPVHQGHGGFPGYHFLTKAVEQVRQRLGSILEKFR